MFPTPGRPTVLLCSDPVSQHPSGCPSPSVARLRSSHVESDVIWSLCCRLYSSLHLVGSCRSLLPSGAASDLTHFLKKINSPSESVCEVFRSQRRLDHLWSDTQQQSGCVCVIVMMINQQLHWMFVLIDHHQSSVELL